MTARLRFLCLALPFAVGCSARVGLGVEPFLWMADHETGDLSQWSEGNTGGTLTSSDGSLGLVTDPVHGGHYAALASIKSVNSTSYARLYRQDNLPAEGYYSIWFYLPSTYAVGQYWNIFELSGRRDASTPNTGVALWSLDLRQESGQLTFYVYDGARAQELKPSAPVAAPIGRWFRVLAFVRQATDQTGRVTFWIDDTLFIDANDVSTVPSAWMSWAVGSAAGQMPQPADIYLDDAMIWRQAAGN